MFEPEEIYGEIRRNPDIYGSIGSGVGAYIYNAVDDVGMKPFLNTWNGDKLFHGVFCYGLAGASLRAVDVAGEYI